MINTQQICKVVSRSDTEQSPSIHIPTSEENVVSNLADRLNTPNANDAKALIAVVRCWNKSTDDIASLQRKLMRFQAACPMLKGALVCIHAENDTDDITLNAVQNLTQRTELPIVPIQVRHYTWTAGLNAGIAVLDHLHDSSMDTGVWNMSFDVEMNEENLHELHEALLDREYVCTIRNNPDGRLPRSYRLMESIADGLAEIIAHPTQDNVKTLVHAMRNTCTVIPLRDIVMLGGFNPICDGLTHEISKLPNELWPVHDERIHDHFQVLGMEDIEFLLRMLHHKHKLSDNALHRAFTSMTETLIRYDDRAWNNKNIDEIHHKLLNETEAVRKIMPGGASDAHEPRTLDEHLINRIFILLQEQDDGVIPERMRDFSFKKASVPHERNGD